MIEPRRARRLTAFRVAAIYLLAGTTWIIVTDLLALDRPSVAVSAFLLSISKGLFFVLASAVLIYVLTAQMTRELAKSESDLALLIREASDPIFVLEPDGRLYDVNRRGLEVLGMSAEAAARLRVEDVITPESLQEQPLAWDRLRAGETVRSVRGIRLASGAT
ncbi:MAG TPA: PAS domain S-box protein, partial [Gemmatimonadales bacterium]|nr:PAS domain S-box protein [Gemmatimonadales bacterium]